MEVVRAITEAQETAMNEDARAWEVNLSSLVVKDDQQERVTAQLVVLLDGQIRDIRATFAEPKRLAHLAHKAICDAESIHLDKRTAVRIPLRRVLGTYRELQHQKQLAETRRVNAEATRQAEDLQLEEAKLLEEAGCPVEAEEVLATPATPPVVAARSTKRDNLGVHLRRTWKHQVTDLSKVPRPYLVADDRKLASYARANQERATVKGVRFYPEVT